MRYDSSPVIDADGRLLGTTRMLHVAQMPHFYEQDYYTPGDHGMPVYETAAGRIGVAICYDRHYPEVMRTLGLQRADLVVVPQAGMVGEWPEGLYEAELRVAAFQNGYFTALANRVGDEPSMTFAGSRLSAIRPGGSSRAGRRRPRPSCMRISTSRSSPRATRGSCSTGTGGPRSCRRCMQWRSSPSPDPESRSPEA